MATGMYVLLLWNRETFVMLISCLYDSFNSTYYGKDYRAGAALLRARRPYLFRNAITGFGLFAFTIAVCECTP